MARLQQFAGGAFGAGGTIALRETLDEPGQDTFKQPSTIFGVGTGLAAAGLWLGHEFGIVETPVLDQDFWGAHAITATPTGLLFSRLPKRQNTSTTEQIIAQARGYLPGAGNGNGGMGGGNGGSAEGVRVQRVNGTGGRRTRGDMSRPR